MKNITLLSLFSLSLMAQPPLKELPPPSKPAEMTNLSLDESNSLALAFFAYYEARIGVLEALAASKAGNNEIQRVNTAEKNLQEQLSAARKAHNVSDQSCIWNFGAKKWQCAETK
jgi:hypothetical protein